MAEKEYIDRNELIDDFQNDLINLHLDGLKGTPRPKEIKIVKVIERIEDFPATNVAPVTHGNWIDKPYPNYPAHDIRYCSECGWNIHKSKLRNSDLNWSYCPNFGMYIVMILIHIK